MNRNPLRAIPSRVGLKTPQKHFVICVIPEGARQKYPKIYLMKVHDIGLRFASFGSWRLLAAKDMAFPIWNPSQCQIRVPMMTLHVPRGGTHC